MNSFTVLLCLAAVALSSAHPPVFRRLHARQYFPAYPAAYPAVYSAPAHYTAALAPTVHYVERVQPAINTVHVPAPLPVASVVETVAPSASYPTYTHTNTQVHTTSGSIYRVDTPVTYTTTLQAPAVHRTYQYDTVHAAAPHTLRYVNGVWC
ncbi:hypothetical protein JYU34_013953 [Plutella xylostella]|uniref:Cuticle protein n=1 Tax=Plutella xylostella TaxID=51655 RepID=A0ABQ7QCB7_PLUXY|nr:hypothetical protein JYU34_013953 [Plutella xylostella]